MFAPFAGPEMKLNFFETYFSCISGAFAAAFVFYFSSEYFMLRARKKRLAALHRSITNGTPLKLKKSFTRFNKLIVRLKRRFGIYGIAFYAPLFLSVPVGSIVTAKFYGKEKRTFPLILLGICMNGAITTGLAYTLKELF
ncbi:hypothetical protein [Fluviicola sp.]|uniref:hypothetical protein n=1 Tax=Fluviicola sp. TaxID=1917219 RepID=UPI0028241C5F|nr:hypothetical protein [Fluviicola sp.]MDR0801665.1 hypothetical protein [Fluviicola sp.]